MTNATAETLAAIDTVHSALVVLSTLALTSYRYPPNCTLTNGSTYDYVIVGGGTAGCVLAYRLSTNSSNKVLLIEAGGYPTLESEFAGLFTPMPLMFYDYDTSSVNDLYTAQNLQGNKVSLTQGKMLGGSSNINHMIYVRGDPHDFDNWASILDDDSWSNENLLPYFKKIENLTDLDLLANSYYADLHGTDGMLKIKRQIANESQAILAALAEAGHPTVNDTTSLTSSLGATNPLFFIDDNLRQSSSIGYLARAKNRPNLCVALSTTATKILIENSTAVGVQVTTSSGTTLEVYANKEVIVSAGAINSPHLLMLSGIGPREHLETLGISVVADLPVGQNLMDHSSNVVVIKMGSDTSVTTSDPHEFPVPTTTLYAALNSSQLYPDYQSINLLFPHDSSGMMQLCANCFKYSADICNKFAAANVGAKVLLAVVNLMMPKSCGNVTLASTDPTVAPLVYTNTYSNGDDLSLMTDSLLNFSKILNTTYFIENNATLVDTGLCSGLNGTEFWNCYALEMSATMWHYSGTCAMGSVTDNEMLVKGVGNLRVADASSFPTLVSGNINAAVTMIGERAAAFTLGE